jgi:heat shock protein HtpX
VITLLLFAHSRKREYAADERAAEVTGNPVALARALAKIHRATSPDRGLRSLLYIHGDERGDDSRRLLSTHPPVYERIDRLVEMAGRSVERHHLGRLRP